jgi:hypothetical protein
LLVTFFGGAISTSSDGGFERAVEGTRRRGAA